MAIELYWGSGSPFAWRVMLALEIKKLAYESKLLEFSKGEHKTPAYLHAQSTGQSADPQRRRLCRLRIDRDHGLPRSQISRAAALRQNARGNRFNLADDIGMRILSRRRRQQGCPARSFSARVWRKSKRSNKRRKRFAKSGNLSMRASPNRIGWSARRSPRRTSPFSPWCSCCLRAASKEAAQPLNLGLMPLSQTYPNLARWVRQIEALPGYERTYPPHWR